MGTDIRPYNKACLLVSIFGLKPLPWQHRTDVCIPIFGLNSLIFILLFGEVFFIIFNIMEMILPDILTW